jgi:hypothetical protein
LSDTDKNKIDSIIDKFEFLSALVNKGKIDRRLAIEAFAGAPALKCWHQLFYYIKKQSEIRGYYVENYEIFARLCLEYFSGRYIPVNYYRTSDTGEILCSLDLLKKLNLDLSIRPRNSREINEGRDC